MLDRRLPAIAADALLSDLLQADFELRRQAHSDLSIRKYAQLIGLNNSTLSQIMRRKRTSSPEVIQKLGRQIGLTRDEIFRLIENEGNQEPHPILQKVTDERFRGIDNWRLDALLEICDGQPIDNLNSRSLSQKLNSSTDEISTMLDFLIESKLLLPKDGRYYDAFKHGTQIDEAQPSQPSAQLYQKSLLDSSAKALFEIESRDRNHTSILFHITPDDLPAIVAAIRKSRRAIATEFQKPEPTRSCRLYALQISLFPLLKESAQEPATDV